MPLRDFNIALVNKISERDRDRLYFSYSVQNEITYTLWDYFASIGKLNPGGYGVLPGPNWHLKPSDLQPFDLVVYFLPDRSRSIVVRAGGPEPPSNAAGWTVNTLSGTVSEVYVEMNLPALKLANIAMHELMHNKLEIDSSMHGSSVGGGGMAASPATERSTLNQRNKQLMAGRLFRAVRQYTGAMS